MNHVSSIYTDSSGYAYLTGHFNSPTLNLGNITITSPNLYLDVFIAKCNSQGTFLWVKKVEDSVLPYGQCYSYAIAGDDQGNIYLTGQIDSRMLFDFLDIAGDYQMYIAKLSQSALDNSEKEDCFNNSFQLFQNYPNPFNPSTTIKYIVPMYGKVTIGVYNVLGKKVATLVNEAKSPGTYSVNFNATDLPSGIYFCKVVSGGYTATRKMMLIK